MQKCWKSTGEIQCTILSIHWATCLDSLSRADGEDDPDQENYAYKDRHPK